MATHERTDDDEAARKRLGIAVKIRRAALELTQDEAAALVGISRGRLSQLETGATPVPLGLLWTLAQALDLDLNQLAGVAPALRDGRAGGAAPIQIRVLHLYREVTMGPRELRQALGAWLHALGTTLERLPEAPTDQTQERD